MLSLRGLEWIPFLRPSVASLFPPLNRIAHSSLRCITTPTPLSTPAAQSSGMDDVSHLSGVISNLRHSSSMDQWARAGEEFRTLFNKADAARKTKLLLYIGKNFAIDKSALDNAITIYQRNKAATNEVKRAVTPLYQLLFQSVGNRLGGVHCICNLREHILDTLVDNPDASLKRIEETAKELLTMWFCLSNLTLSRLTWQSPADLVHKVAKYEAVHPVAGIADLQRRVGPLRRCFLFTHEAMPREPLVVVHVALMERIADNMQEILKSSDGGKMDEQATTAIYYSISSTQKGLAGIDLGNLLIKGVVMELQKELPNVKEHSTLSPIPGFRPWVLRSLRGKSEFGDVVDESVRRLVEAVTGRSLSKQEAREALCDGLSKDRLTVQMLQPLKDILMRLCAIYLTKAKRNGFALNPVANFHVRNGAQVYRLNWAADSSVRGVDRSFGIMVNYKYNLEEVHENSEKYTSKKEMNVHPHVIDLLE